MTSKNPATEDMATQKKICIIGFSGSTREEAPTDDSWEYWGLNTLWKHVERPWSRWFEMHTEDFSATRLDEETMREHLEWLTTTSLPVYMLKARKEFPSSVDYPLNEVRNGLAIFFNHHDRKYFASSISYMFAMAMSELAQKREHDRAWHRKEYIGEIAVYGVDMVKESEWGYQRPNMEYLIGLARGAGIKVTLPERGGLCKSQWLYGYEDPESARKNIAQAEELCKMRIKELDGQCKDLKKEVDQKNAEYFVNLGAFKEEQIWLEKLRDIQRGCGI